MIESGYSLNGETFNIVFSNFGCYCIVSSPFRMLLIYNYIKFMIDC